MMRTTILILFSFSLVYAAIDKPIVDVYFGNGIDTKQTSAIISAGVLKDAIIEKFGLEYYYQHISKVHYAYNRTVSKGWDLFESTYQKLGLQAAVDEGFKLVQSSNATIHDIDLTRQLHQYEESINQGHNVLVVAHFQGNLFAEDAYVKKALRV